MQLHTTRASHEATPGDKRGKKDKFTKSWDCMCSQPSSQALPETLLALEGIHVLFFAARLRP